MDEDLIASGLCTVRMKTLRDSVNSAGKVDATNSDSISESLMSELITY